MEESDFRYDSGVLAYWILARELKGMTDQANSVVQLGLGVLLGGVVGWVIPEVIGLVRTSWFEQRPIRALLGRACLNQYETLIYMGSLAPKDSRIFFKARLGLLGDHMEVAPNPELPWPWVVVENDARALGYLMGILAKAGKVENLAVVRDDVGADQVEVNMICIGSIKNNHVTAAINSSFANLPLRFAWLDDRLLITDGKSKWYSDEQFDYGLLVKATNEYAPHLNVWICAGISHFGTASAAHVLFSRWRELYEKYADSNFSLVVKTRVGNFKYVEIVHESIDGGVANGESYSTPAQRLA